MSPEIAVLRGPRTIADLECCDGIETPHIEEAVNYRPFDRKIFA
jgi:predicted ATPase with chaperone activity